MKYTFYVGNVEIVFLKKCCNGKEKTFFLKPCLEETVYTLMMFSFFK